MTNDEVVLKLLLQYSIQNAKDCVINTRELTRTSTADETKKHRSKYASDLRIKHISLMSNIQLLFNISNSKDIHVFDNTLDQKILINILDTWQRINANLKPYQIIQKDLEKLYHQVIKK